MDGLGWVGVRSGWGRPHSLRPHLTYPQNTTQADPIGFQGLCIKFLEIGRAGEKPVESLNTSKMGGVSRADDIFLGCKCSG